jgi:GNAT superfamily N-acetyltransferase
MSVVLRDPRLGDLGLVIQRQAILYATEYNWDWTYEGLTAEIVGGYVRNFDPAREQGWIAELDGRVVGSIFLMRGDDPTTAKLRLLYVDASARGLGLGGRLVEACVTRARQCGYRRLELWTCDLLVSARRLYEAAGFQLDRSEPRRLFGHDLVTQTWALDLNATKPAAPPLPSRDGDHDDALSETATPVLGPRNEGA